MKKVALVIDNSSGMPEEDIKKLNPQKIIPISFMINGEEYYENETMSYSQFYEFLQDKNTNVSTSQPSAEFIREGYREVLKDYDELIHLILSSGLSEACNSATHISHEEEVEGKVYVVDNGGVAFLNKVPMFKANAMIEQGKSAKEIKGILESEKGDTAAYIAVDTLKYLKKGGRITPLAAAVGSLLNIKPVLQIQGQKLDAYSKVRGKSAAKKVMLRAIAKDLNERFAEAVKEKRAKIALAYTGNYDEALEWKAEVSEVFPDYELFLAPLSLSVSCHIGQGALAIVAMDSIEKK